MIRKECPSYPVSIFIAGHDVPRAEDVCAAYCDEVGLCVTVTMTEYVYTGDKELGLIIGLINYPRFPAAPEAILAHAEQLAERLRTALKQDSYSIQTPETTYWVSHRAQGTSARQSQDPQGLGP